MRHMHDGVDARGGDDYVAAMQAAVSTDAGHLGLTAARLEEKASVLIAAGTLDESDRQ